MIEKFVKAWDANKENLRNYIASHNQSEYSDYKSLVSLIFEHVINPYLNMINRESYDVYKIHEIDDGEYQGTLLYLIPIDTYQPSQWEYVITYVGYGSCSGCDTLLAISEYEMDYQRSNR